MFEAFKKKLSRILFYRFFVIPKQSEISIILLPNSMGLSRRLIHLSDIYPDTYRELESTEF